MKKRSLPINLTLYWVYIRIIWQPLHLTGYVISCSWALLCLAVLAASLGCPCIFHGFWNRAPAGASISLMFYNTHRIRIMYFTKSKLTYPLCKRLTMSKFSLAILSSSLFLTPSFKLLGFMLIERLVTCCVVGTEARLPWEISSKFLINMALFLLIWFSRSKKVRDEHNLYLGPKTFWHESWAKWVCLWIPISHPTVDVQSGSMHW